MLKLTGEADTATDYSPIFDGVRTMRTAIGPLELEETGKMAAEDDDRPVRKAAHEIGQDLSNLSLDDLADRVALLKEEIKRLEAEILSKGTSRRAADSIFR